MKQNPQLNLGPIKKLILHFDLNKTILLSDAAGQKSKDEMVYPTKSFKFKIKKR